MSGAGETMRGGGSLKSLKQKQFTVDNSQLTGGENQEKINNVVNTAIQEAKDFYDPDSFFYKKGYPNYNALLLAQPSPDVSDIGFVSNPKSIYICDIQGQWTLYTASMETINQLFADLKDGVPVEGDTLSKLYNLILDRYTKSETDALLNAKENVLYDVRATEGIIFNLTHLDYVDKLAFATDTNKVFQGCLADGALYWSCANGGEMTFSATLTPNQVKNISLFSPIKYKSEYALNMLVVATAGGLENRISARMFHVYGQNSGYINKISTRTNDSQETTLCEVSSTTSTVNNQIQMQLSSKSSQNISIQCYIN